MEKIKQICIRIWNIIVTVSSIIVSIPMLFGIFELIVFLIITIMPFTKDFLGGLLILGKPDFDLRFIWGDNGYIFAIIYIISMLIAMLNMHIENNRHPKPIKLSASDYESEIGQKLRLEREQKEQEENEKYNNYIFHGIYGSDTGRAKYINDEYCKEIEDAFGNKKWASITTTYDEDDVE